MNDELTDALFRDKPIPQGGFPKQLPRKEVVKCFEEKLRSLGAEIERVSSEKEIQKFKLRVG